MYEELGFQLKFKTKPMTKSLMAELMELEKQEIECELPFHDEFDIDYMNSLESYELKKDILNSISSKALSRGCLSLNLVALKEDAYENRFRV